MVLIEAQSYGIPIISYDCPEGPSEIIVNGKNGYLIDVDDEKSFIEKLIDLSNNESLWEDMHKASIEENERFSVKVVFDKWDKLIKMLLDKKNKRYFNWNYDIFVFGGRQCFCR